MVVLTQFQPPSTGIQCQEGNTQAFIKDKCYGDGTLYIAEDRLSWVGSSGEGFTLDYPSITLHAVSRDVSSFPHECLYLMLDCDITDEEKQDDENSNSEESEEDTLSEVRFVPADKSKLDTMYGAMNACQLLHPDINDDMNEGDDFYGTNDGNAMILSEQGHRNLNHLESIFSASGDAAPNDAPNGEEADHDDAQYDNTEEPMDHQFDDAD